MDEETRQTVRALFGDVERPPTDVVPPHELTLDDVRRMNDATGKPCRGVLPGELLTGPDGEPVGIGAPREVESIFGGYGMSRAEAERLGVTREEFPNIHIIEEATHDDD